MDIDLMSLSEVAEYLKRPKSTIYYWVRLHKIPFMKPVSKNLYFSKSDINAWLKDSLRINSNSTTQVVQNG